MGVKRKASKYVSQASNSYLAGFTIEDRQLLNQTNESVNQLSAEVLYLKDELEKNRAELKQTKAENEALKSMVNSTRQATNIYAYKLDDLEMYGRRENLRILGIAEALASSRDDSEEKVIKLATELGINLQARDLQRAHRLGKKKVIGAAKPRPIIVRFMSYKKRQEFMFAKAKLRDMEGYAGVFIAEDLTQLRAKLLKYVKNDCTGDFVSCHTMNGRIRIKRSAVKAGIELKHGERDQGVGKWLYVSYPDDLFRHNINIDFTKLNYQPLSFNLETDDNLGFAADFDKSSSSSAAD